MTDKDPLLLNMISSKKQQSQPEAPERDLHNEYTQKMGAAEKQRIIDEKEQKEALLKAELLYKVLEYHEKIPFVSEGGPKKERVLKMSYKELQEERYRIGRILNSRSALEVVRKIDYGINFGIELALLSQKIPANGLSDFSRSDQGLEMMQQEHIEFAIEWGEWLAQSKEARYFWKTVSKVLWIIDNNKKNFDVEVPEEKTEEYKDL